MESSTQISPDTVGERRTQWHKQSQTIVFARKEKPRWDLDGRRLYDQHYSPVYAPADIPSRRASHGGCCCCCWAFTEGKTAALRHSGRGGSEAVLRQLVRATGKSAPASLRPGPLARSARQQEDRGGRQQCCLSHTRNSGWADRSSQPFPSLRDAGMGSWRT